MSAQQPQPVPDSKIITLLEENKLNPDIDPPGTFTITLDEQVILKDGDSLQMNKAFIDNTPAETSFVEVTEAETEITIKHGIYLTDIHANETDAKPTWGKWSSDVAYRPDAKKYVMQNEQPSFGNTFLNWKLSDNTGSGGTQDFQVELNSLVPEDNTGFEYEVIDSISPPTAPAYPISPGLPLEKQYMLGGHMILKQTDSKDPLIGPYEFYFYPRGYTPTGSAPGPNDHTAVFQRWTDSEAKILGWRATINSDSTETIEERKWLFTTAPPTLYNYFSTAGLPHMIQLNSFSMPMNNEWSPAYYEHSIDPNAPWFPGVTIQWYDPRTESNHIQTKVFNAKPYAPLVDSSGNLVHSAMDVLYPELKKYTIPRPEVPKEFQEAKYGWGPNSGWDWYQLKQFVDPYAKTSPELLPPIVFSIDHPPTLKTWFFNKDGVPEDAAFVNFRDTRYYNSKTFEFTCQPWQLRDTSPVVQPDATGTTLLPREYTSTFTIPSGKYTNENFAKLLTDTFNSLTNPIVGLSNNPLGEASENNLAGFSSSYFYQTTYETMQQYDGYSATASDPNVRGNLTRYPNNYVYSKIVTPERTLFDGTVLAEIPAKTKTQGGFQPYWVSEDGQSLFQFDDQHTNPTSAVPGVARGFGASSVSVLFDEAESAFSIAQAHTPIYSDGPTVGGQATDGSQIIQQIAVAYPDEDPPVNTLSWLPTHKTADASSGIFFTSMEPESLFFNKMRLDRNMLTTLGAQNPVIKDFTSTESSFATVTKLESTMTHTMKLNKGVNITGLFLGADSLVPKNASFSTVSSYTNQIATTDLVSITGDGLVVASDDDPFYSIEISGINNQSIFGQNQKNNLVQAIVGKYYNNGTFTSSEGDGFMYVHKGEPMSIKNLRVRILTSQGQPQEGLGAQSAVVLTLSTTK